MIPAGVEMEQDVADSYRCMAKKKSQYCKAIIVQLKLINYLKKSKVLRVSYPEINALMQLPFRGHQCPGANVPPGGVHL